MIIIELTYKKSLGEVNELLQAHRDFLDKYYKKNIFLISGPKNPRNGGIILSMQAQATINEIIKEDPFYQEGIADYRVIEFEPTKFSDNFVSLLQK